jgi:hypothetical protein
VTPEQGFRTLVWCVNASNFPGSPFHKVNVQLHPDKRPANLTFSQRGILPKDWASTLFLAVWSETSPICQTCFLECGSLLVVLTLNFAMSLFTFGPSSRTELLAVGRPADRHQWGLDWAVHPTEMTPDGAPSFDSFPSQAIF